MEQIKFNKKLALTTCLIDSCQDIDRSYKLENVYFDIAKDMVLTRDIFVCFLLF